MNHEAFEQRLDAVLRRKVDGVRRLLRAERLSGGASQETYRLVVEREGEEGETLLALRRSAHGESVEANALGGPGMRVEAMLIDAARAAGVPAPTIHHVLNEADDLGTGFVMEWLEGETLGAKINHAEDLAEVRPRLARECGRILGRIHAIDLDATGLRSELKQVDPATYVRETWARYRQYRAPQPMIDFTARWLLDHLPPASEPRLVHNDFRNGNLMVTPEGVTAVLDWELAHVGDPMRDLGWLCTNSWRFGSPLPVGGFGEREDLFAGYEEQTGKPVDPAAVKFWEAFGSFWWSIVCLEMAMFHRHGSDDSVERATIGRRTSEGQVDCVNLLIPGPVALVEPAAVEDLDLPRADELLASVRSYLKGDVVGKTSGRTKFLARVSANALGIVEREWTLAVPARAQEKARLESLLGTEASLAELRTQLCEALREGTLALDDPALTAHLRATVVNQVAIDQPRYSGFSTARAR